MTRAIPLLALSLVVNTAACQRAETATSPSTAPSVVTTRVWHNVPYANVSSAQQLDIYLPATGNGPFPLVVWVHGGGWQSGTKALADNAMQRRVLERGFALASIEYRLSGEAIFPAQIHDVKAAIRFLRARRQDFHLETTRIGAWGSSAGGHLVALLGTSGGAGEIEGTLGNAEQSSRVQAVVDWYGPTDLTLMDSTAVAMGCPGSGHSLPSSPESQLLGGPVPQRRDAARLASALTYVSADDPPFFIQHGTADCTVAHGQSILLRDALRKAGVNVPVDFELLAGAGHGGPEFAAVANVDKVLAFWERVLKP